MQKTRNKELEQLKSKIITVLKRKGIKKASIFGSYARGEQKKSSDIDILVELPKPLGFGFVGIQLELEKKLGKKVDLLTYKEINPHIKRYILADEVRIL